VINFSAFSVCSKALKKLDATGQDPLFLGLFFGGWQNIKKREVFAAARLDVGPFSYYLFVTFSLLF
jgi:hypothetical protein